MPEPERVHRKGDLVLRRVSAHAGGRRIPSARLEAAGLFAFLTPSGLFSCLQQPLCEIPELSAPRADVTVAGRARHRGFLLPRRLRLLSPPKTARRRFPSALAVPATPPHGGATSGFGVSGGYALDCAAKAAQTADTGATAREVQSVTAASPAWEHPAPAKSPDRAAPAVCVPSAYSRLPSFRAARLSLPHSGDR